MLDPQIVRQQIENLRLQHGDLEADEESWLLALESETDLDVLLDKLMARLDETLILQIGIDVRIAELKQRQARVSQREDSIRKAMLALMQAAGVKKKELPAATLSVTKGRERVVILDEASVPDILCRIERKPNLTAIKEMLTRVDGATVNWAAVETSDPTLSVRTK